MPLLFSPFNGDYDLDTLLAFGVLRLSQVKESFATFTSIRITVWLVITVSSTILGLMMRILPSHFRGRPGPE